MSPDGLEELTRQLLAEIDRHRNVNDELTRFRVLARRAQGAAAEDHAGIVADLAAVVP